VLPQAEQLDAGLLDSGLLETLGMARRHGHVFLNDRNHRERSARMDGSDLYTVTVMALNMHERTAERGMARGVGANYPGRR